MMLAHAGVQYENVMYTEQEWYSKVKPTMPNGKVPAWQPAGSDLKLGQSLAILHMLGKQYGYLAESSETIYKQEFAIECQNDFMNSEKLYLIFRDELTQS